ncbi:hypothetical protein GCM10028807_09090 [Spirosoma daeguense]
MKISVLSDAKDLIANQIMALLARNSNSNVEIKIGYLGAIIAGLLCLTNQAHAQVSGTVFRDYTGDGIRQTSSIVSEPGVANVTVRAFNNVGAQVGATATSDANGNYSISVPNGTSVRVEFSSLPAGAFPTAFGTNSKTLIQFVSAPATTVSLGVLSQADYDTYGYHLFTSCYANGDSQTGGSQSASETAIAGINYYSKAKFASSTLGQVGAIWGMAYAKNKERLYMASVVRRHVGFGPNGIGAIYKADPYKPNTTSLFYDLGASVGSVTGRDLPATLAAPSYDLDAFAKVGIAGIGDIDLSTDESTLYVVNLNDRLVYRISIDANGNAVAGSLTALPAPPYIATPPCTNGTARPWALKVHNDGTGDKLYLGMVCSAGVSQTWANLSASVYEYNPATNSWVTTPRLSFPLNYLRQDPGGNNAYGNNFGWKPWTNDYAGVMLAAYNATTQTGGYEENASRGGGNYAQPILSDIEIDGSGDMILGFLDRGGIQFGSGNFPPVTGSTTLVSYVSAGDILRAGRNANGTYTIENNGITNGTGGTKTTSMPNPFTVNGYTGSQTAAPGGREFYWGEYYVGGAGSEITHFETPFGGLAYVPGKNEILLTAMDPENTINSGGVLWLDNTNGSKSDGVNLYTNGGGAGYFAKAVGLGDIEPIPSPDLGEIGNRIWTDIDKDGVQDAGEPGISGLTVTLYSNNTLVATTTTDANGEYYFNLSNVPGGLLPNTTYQIRVVASQLPIQNLGLTGANLGGNDELDSDAQLTGGQAVITLTTGTEVGINHSYDIGFSCATVTATSTTICVGQTISLTATSSSSNATYSWTGPNNFTATGAVLQRPNATGAMSGSYVVTQSTPSAFLGTTNLVQNSNFNSGNTGFSSDYTAAISTTATGTYQVGQPASVTANSMGTACNDHTNGGSITGNMLIINGSTVANQRIWYQTYTVIPNVAYQFSYWATSFSASNLPILRTTIDGQTSGATLDFTGIGTCIWRQYLYTFTPTTSSVTLAIIDDNLLGPGNNFGIDDISLYPYESCSSSDTVNVLVKDPIINISTTPGVCNPATNQYTLSGTVSLTNATSGALVVSTGVGSTTLNVTSATQTLPFSFTGLLSNGASQTITANLSDCGSASAVFTAPVSCTVAPCGIDLTVTPGLCLSATNSYVLSGMISTSNVPTSGTLTISSGAFTPRSLTLPAGNASGTFSYSGLVSNGQTYILTASYSNSACAPVSQTYTAPVTCSVAPVCSLTANVTAGLCASATNTYSATAVVTVQNPVAGVLTITHGAQSATLATTNATGPVAYTAIFVGLTSDGVAHTVTASLPSCSTTSVQYTAPVSCSVAPICSLTANVTAGLCASATNTYSAVAVVTLTNPIPGILTVTNGAQSLTFATTAVNSATYTATFNGLTSDGAPHTVTATLAGCGTTSAQYTAPVSCSVAPVCSLTANVTAGLCASATNAYSATAVVTIQNPTIGILTITNGALSATFATSAAPVATYTVEFPGLASDGAAHTVTATLAGCGTTSAQYTAPVSCSVTPVCGLSVTASGANCNPTTNLYVLSGTIYLTNSPGSQTLTLTDGSYVRSLTANASTTSINFSYTTIQSDGALHTVTVTSSATACSSASTTYTAPASCSIAPVCSLSATATPGLCVTATNTYSMTVLVSLTNPAGGVVTVATGTASITANIPASSGQVIFPAIFNGLPSDGAAHTVTATLAGCGTTSAQYTAPVSCTAVALEIQKFVDKSRARLGEVISYTVVLTNTGNNSASNVVVRDSMGLGLTYVANSATAPAGTTFTQGTPVNTWAVSSIGAGQSLSLTLQSIADSTGILHNTAYIPGDTASVCTSIPARVCSDDLFEFTLTAPAGQSTYQWYKDGQPIANATTNILSVTAIGAYTLRVDNQSGQCPEFSCCPFIVEEDTIPRYQAATIPVNCIGNVAQSDGQIVLSGFQPGYTYQYSLGSSFSSSVSGAPQVIPANGVIANNLANPTIAQAYTVRVYNQAGCYTDVTVLLIPTVCGCPAEICVPFVLQQTKRARRIGDPIR